MSDEIEEAVDAYLRDLDVSPTLTAVTEAALREFLAARGYLDTGRRLRIQPADEGSGRTDISIEHDRYFAER